MRRTQLIATVVFCVAVVPHVAWATPGIFQGKIYQPAKQSLPEGWIYVLGRNHMLRKVEISRATVEYADSVPAGERADQPHAALVDGTEVRVTAEQDKSGEWRASRVEIIKLSRSRLHPASHSGCAR